MAPANSAPTPAPSTAHRACSTRSGRTVVRRGLGALAALIVLAVVGPAALTIPAGAQTTTPPGVAEADAEVAPEAAPMGRAQGDGGQGPWWKVQAEKHRAEKAAREGSS